MSFQQSNVYSFRSLTSIGIDKVPLNKIVFVQDDKSFYEKLNNTGVSSASSIQAAIDSGAVSLVSSGNTIAGAPLDSPNLTGTPTAPTAASGTNTTQLATTAFVSTAITNVIGGASTALDTLRELEVQLRADENASTALTTLVGTKAGTVSPVFTGTPSAPTAVSGTNTTQIATTAFVANAISGLSSGGSSYTLPISSASTLGGVKVGSGLSIDSAGILSATTSGGNASFKEFTVQFAGSTPSAVSSLPSGWTSSISGNDVTITHTMGVALKTIQYWGYSVSGGLERYRLPSASNEASIPYGTRTTQFTFRISTAVAGADTDGTARVVVGF